MRGRPARSRRQGRGQHAESGLRRSRRPRSWGSSAVGGKRLDMRSRPIAEVSKSFMLE